MKLGVRAQYPENNEFNWYDFIKPYSKLCSLEVAFFDPRDYPKAFLENVEINDVIKPVKALEINVCSVHMADQNLREEIRDSQGNFIEHCFTKVFEKTIEIAKNLECSNIVIHPEKGDNKVFEKYEKFLDDTLEQNNLNLCWETFESGRRLFSGFENMFEYCKTKSRHKVCYDFSHVHLNQEDTLKFLDANLDLIKIFHVSNRSQEYRRNSVHLPIEHKEGDLNFREIFSFLKQKNYSGSIVLEYLPQYHEKMAGDIVKIKDYLKV